MQERLPAAILKEPAISIAAGSRFYRIINKPRSHPFGVYLLSLIRNEILYAFNQGEKFVLAIVLVGEHDEVDGPHYIRNPFDREPAWGVASINDSLNDLPAKRIEMEILS